MYLLFFKRWFDFSFTLIAILMLSWLITLILLIYFLSFQFPILFKQERIGKNNKPFLVHKFRTLREEGKNMGERRFWWGDFLRFFSLDEIPQLWNVLKGEMSLIGPRPLPVEYLPLMNDEQKRRHSVLPGITGWAQVNGRHEINWKKKFDLDVFYVENISFKLDFLILLKTGALLLSLKKDVSLNEEKFKGN